jgi:hypothetical protein
MISGSRFRRVLGVLLGCTAFAMVAFGTGSAQAAEPAVAWEIDQTTNPTYLIPGSATEGGDEAPAAVPRYFLTVTNAGGATAEDVTITDTLPVGVVPVKTSEFRIPGHVPAACDPAGGQTITCHLTEPIAPGVEVSVWIPIEVEAGAPATITNSVTITSSNAPVASQESPTTVSDQPPPFELLGSSGLAATALDEAGQTPPAGAHPFTVRFHLSVPTKAQGGGGFREVRPLDPLRSVGFELPDGLAANPTAAERCLQREFNGEAHQPAVTCRAPSQVGRVEIDILGVSPFISPLYDLQPAAGLPAEFGFILAGSAIHVAGGLDSSFHLTAKSREILAKFPFPSLRVELWGYPSDPRFDRLRSAEACASGCSIQPSPAPFLTMPTSCTEQMTLGASVTGWLGGETERTVPFTDLEGNPIDVNGCNALEFEPTIASKATTNVADSPSGLDFNLHQPQAAIATEEGTVEHCEPGSWKGNPSSYAFRWLRNGVPIPGAEDHSYVVAAEDVGSALQCEVAASNNAVGPGRAASRPILVQPSAAVSPNPGKPTINFKEGSPNVRVCDPGTWGGTPEFTIQWFKDGALVAGQTAETYEVQPGEAPLTLQCEVSGSAEGTTAVAFSANQPSNPPLEPALPESVLAPGTHVSGDQLPLATAALKDTTVTLPAGMTLNASAASGLGSCTEAQMGYAPEGSKIRFATTPQTCPAASKLGNLEVSTPLIEHRLPGTIYLARPYENPFGNLTAIYLAVEDEESGIVAKLAGKVTPDPITGQLSATFGESPQLPIEDIDLHFFNGARAALTTPLTCGTKTTTSTLTPWSTPEGQDVHPSDSFETQVAAGGSGVCPSSEANAPNTPVFTAGTVSPEAGAYSPFLLRLARQDGTQRLTAIDTTLPKGLAAKFAGIPYCSEAQIAQAQSRSNPNQGALEKASPSCPSASEVGTVNVGAGSGPTPTYVSGHAYLAGPYKGAPLSLAIITPAIAGPFDLGAVVVRTAVYINPETAQGRAVSDPLPSILQGVPLDIRSIAVKLDRPGFTLNPTSCDPMAIAGAATALTGQSAVLSSPFQVGGCNALKFKPKLAISLKGGTRRHDFPALKAVLTYPKGGSYANISSAQVTLPHSAFLEQGHIGTVCTRVQFAASACPKASIYGKAKAITPLLDKPLEGPVYLRSSSHELPDLVAALNGQIDVVLAGRVDTGKGGGIRNTFEAVPDAPVSKFVLEMKGGKKGLLVNSENICRKPQKASVSFTAQNGDALSLAPTIKNSCKGKAKKRGGKKKGR